MAKMTPEGSQFDANDYDSRMQELLKDDELFTSYYEVFERFDDINIQENLLRGIYAYGNNTDTGAAPAALGRRKNKGKRKRKARSTPDDRAAQPQDRPQQHE